MKNYKAKCVKQAINSGLMFILDEVYTVQKSDYLTLHEYVIVFGFFTNSHNERHELKRIISKEICEKHLKIQT